RANVLSEAPPVAPKSTLHSYIEHVIPAASDPSIDSVFSEDGIFSQKFSGFEYRSGQLEMARAVDTAFKNEEHLVVEAGTGVGKSFAYLVPAMEFARRSKAKVVVSTNTKNLQEQLFYKDLPQLKQMLAIPFKAVLVKGRENYICERRWEEIVLQQDKELTAWDAQALMYMFVWKSMTNTGDISENSSFDRKRFNITWRKVCSDRFMCSNRKCHHYRKCHVMNLRKQIEDASIVVANHSLLLADMQMDNSTLGEYSYLVIDEAHNLMASASKHLGADLSYAESINLIHQIGATQRKQKSGFLATYHRALAKSVLSDQKKIQATTEAQKLEESLDELRKLLLDTFNLASTMCRDADSYNKLRIKAIEEASELFDRLKDISISFKKSLKSLEALYHILGSFDSKQVPEYDNLLDTLAGLRMRFAEMEGVILLLLNPDFDNHAMWIENNPRPDRNIPSAVINYAPVEVGEHLHRLLYKQIPSIVFTSATLALRGSFRYFLNQSGLNLTTEKQVRSIVVDSPFDYDSQARLLITSFLPEPKDKYFQNQALACLGQVFETTDVGTMALFTSYKDLNSVYEYVADAMYHAQRPFYAQGKGGSRR
ncbi:MAG TPA: DEAD/DEAH box helicase family protein, partial [Candidatus Cloacimonadota bacterium]|nr:DEAD/DEAH box helicase family protein [Candidatus Cloacimonadota bacterium]